MGVGLGLACLIAFAGGQPGIGIGVGGGLAILGLAAFIGGALHAGDEPVESPGPEATRDMRCGAGYSLGRGDCSPLEPVVDFAAHSDAKKAGTTVALR